MQIQISWLLQKPNDLDLHCLLRQGISGFSKTRVKYCSTYLLVFCKQGTNASLKVLEVASKIVADDSSFIYLFFFSDKVRLAISCKLSAKPYFYRTIMKQIKNVVCYNSVWHFKDKDTQSSGTETALPDCRF